eukprot:scaffold35002_cov150-Skeletonema_dohrnii-CCMP3373.AAC.2
MPTLIRTLKRINRCRSPKTKTKIAAQNPHNDLAPLVNYESRLRKKTEATAARAAEMNKKLSSDLSDDDTSSPQKASAAANRDIKSTPDYSDRKRESSLPETDRSRRYKRPYVYVNICSSEGCSNQGRQGGVCVHMCGSEGCPNSAVEERVRHDAKASVQLLCNREGCTNHAREGGVCWRHGENAKRWGILRCSIEGCPSQRVKGGMCKSHGEKKVMHNFCSREGCKLLAQTEGLCIKHGSIEVDELQSPLSSTPSLASLLYFNMQLPNGCLSEDDGCDDDELVARAMRCQEIMKLSQQAKEAEAARVYQEIVQLSQQAKEAEAAC